jgi:serine/threonine protein kinase
VLANQIVLEYYGGGSLYDLAFEERFTESVTRVLLRQMISGVKFMHSVSLIHFDLKLDNFMADGQLKLDNAAAWIKVIDFGWTESVKNS